MARTQILLADDHMLLCNLLREHRGVIRLIANLPSVRASGVRLQLRPLPLNVYSKAMDASKREAHGKVVPLVLAPKVA